MRPDAAFRFEDGRVVIEVDVAAGMDSYGDHAWPEIIVTTVDAPTPYETNGWYAAGIFGGYPVVACGLPADRLSECRICDRDTISAHLSAMSTAGAAFAEGGAPTTPARDARGVRVPRPRPTSSAAIASGSFWRRTRSQSP